MSNRSASRTARLSGSTYGPSAASGKIDVRQRERPRVTATLTAPKPARTRGTAAISADISAGSRTNTHSSGRAAQRHSSAVNS